MTTLGILYIVAIALALVIAILWICLPFAVFGVKPLLEKLLAETRSTNELLRRLNKPGDTP